MGQTVFETLSGKPIMIKRAGGVAQGVGTEFNHIQKKLL
jgi:hypothetical protein